MRALKSLLSVPDLPGRPATFVGSAYRLLQAQKHAACVSFSSLSGNLVNAMRSCSFPLQCQSLPQSEVFRGEDSYNGKPTEQPSIIWGQKSPNLLLRQYGPSHLRGWSEPSFPKKLAGNQIRNRHCTTDKEEVITVIAVAKLVSDCDIFPSTVLSPPRCHQATRCERDQERHREAAVGKPIGSLCVKQRCRCAFAASISARPRSSIFSLPSRAPCFPFFTWKRTSTGNKSNPT